MESREEMDLVETIEPISELTDSTPFIVSIDSK